MFYKGRTQAEPKLKSKIEKPKDLLRVFKTRRGDALI